jgi:hypothetical protein
MFLNHVTAHKKKVSHSTRQQMTRCADGNAGLVCLPVGGGGGGGLAKVCQNWAEESPPCLYIRTMQFEI